MSIADTGLGLSAAEIQILRTQQQTIEQRTSQLSLHPSSAPRSQSLQGRVLLDPHSLRNLEDHLQNVVRTVEERIDEIQASIERSVQASQRGVHRSQEVPDREMARMRRAVAEFDRLGNDVERIKNVRNKVKEIRIRVDKFGNRMANPVLVTGRSATTGIQATVHRTSPSYRDQLLETAWASQSQRSTTHPTSHILDARVDRPPQPSALHHREAPAPHVKQSISQPVVVAITTQSTNADRRWGSHNLRRSRPKDSQMTVGGAYACDKCRDSRKSCDGSKPTCHSCRIDGVECSYIRIAVPWRRPASTPATLVLAENPRLSAQVVLNNEVGLLSPGMKPTSLHERESETSSSSTVTTEYETDTRQENSSNSSLDSRIDSEGEQSFVYGTNNEAMYAFAGQHRVPFLSGQLAGLILKAFVLSRHKETPAQFEGSSAREDTRQNPNEASASFSVPTQSRGNPAKRSLKTRKNLGDSEDSDDDRSAKRPSRIISTAASKQRFFACPYYRYDVGRYSELNMEEVSYRGCSSACLRDISRLKQHLYRVHRQPEYYCGSCYSVFKDQVDLNTHTRQRPACDNGEAKFQEKMDREQVTAIKRRNVGREAHAEWFNIFKILFPHVPVPNASIAYADGDSNTVVERFNEYFEHEAPSILSTLLVSELRDRISLDEHRRIILDEAVEQASSRFVSLLRPRLNRLVLHRSHAQTEALEHTVRGVSWTEMEAANSQLAELDNMLNTDHVQSNLAQQLPALDTGLNVNFTNVDFELEPWFNFDEVGQE